MKATYCLTIAALVSSFAARADARAAQTSASPDQIITVSMTGCVERASSTVPSPGLDAAGTKITTANPLFVLTHTRAERSAGGRPAPDETQLAPLISTYRLAGNDEGLANYVGRRVAVTGTVDKRDPALATTGRGASDPLAQPKLMVTSIRDAGGVCSGY